MRNQRILATSHLLAPRDADERVTRAQFVLAMLTAIVVVAACVLLVIALG